LVEALMPRTLQPIPATDAISIAGDPRLQLGDVLKIADPDGFGADMRVQIYGIQREWSLDSGLTDALTVEMIRPEKVSYWDDGQYGLWGQSMIWS
jgi:hypothetical protein